MRVRVRSAVSSSVSATAVLAFVVLLMFWLAPSRWSRSWVQVALLAVFWVALSGLGWFVLRPRRTGAGEASDVVGHFVWSAPLVVGLQLGVLEGAAISVALVGVVMATAFVALVTAAARTGRPG